MEVRFIIFIGISVSLEGIVASWCGTLYFTATNVQEGETVTFILSSQAESTHREWVRDVNSTRHFFYNSSSTETSCKYREEIKGIIYKLHIDYVDKNDEGYYHVKCDSNIRTSSWSSTSTFLTVMSNSSQENICGTLEARQNNVEEGTDFELVFWRLSEETTILQKEYDQRTFHDIESGIYELSSCGKRVRLKVKTIETTYGNVANYRVACGERFSNVVTVNIVRIRPEKPTFLYVKDVNECKNCIPAHDLKQATVQCSTVGGSRPSNFSMLWSGRIVNSTIIDRRIRSNLTHTFTATILDTNTMFTCTVWNSVDQRELQETAKVFIYVKPSKIAVTGLPVKENVSSEIECTVYNGSALLLPKIYIKDSLHNMTGKETLKTGDTYTVRAGLTKTFKREDYNDSVSCCVDQVEGKVCGGNNTLNVLFPPITIELKETHTNITDDGDANITLTCTVGSSNPPVKISWTGGMNTRSELDSEEIKSFSLNKAHNGREIICSAVNGQFPEKRISAKYVVNITYAPLITIPGDGNRAVYIGQRITLTCEVDSNPASRITWRDGKKQIIDSTGKTIDLTFPNASQGESFNYTCDANNNIGGLRRKTVTLTVKDSSLKPYEETSSDKSEFSSTGPVIGGAAGLIIVVVATVLCIIRHKRRKLPQKTQQESQQEEITTKRISQRARDRALQQVETAQGNNPTNESKMTVEMPEYASVAPKATRAVQKNEPTTTTTTTKQTKKETNETTEHQLVYAELDLQTHSPVKPVEKQQQEATEYVGIDFAKTGTVKAEDFVEYGNM